MIDKMDEIKKALEYYAKNSHSWISGNEICHAVNALSILTEMQNEQAVDVEAIRSDIAAILNQARCLERREVGNIELSERIRDHLASRGLLRTNEIEPEGKG